VGTAEAKVDGCAEGWLEGWVLYNQVSEAVREVWSWAGRCQSQAGSSHGLPGDLSSREKAAWITPGPEVAMESQGQAVTR
jgi:hypothetical protein